jgi:hypothetical protein
MTRNDNLALVTYRILSTNGAMGVDEAIDILLVPADVPLGSERYAETMNLFTAILVAADEGQARPEVDFVGIAIDLRVKNSGLTPPKFQEAKKDILKRFRAQSTAKKYANIAASGGGKNYVKDIIVHG